MKIGILTQPLLDNYGGLLQNYALQEVLKRMGHNAVTLDWDTKFKSVYKGALWKRMIIFFFYPLVLVRRKYYSKREKYELTIEEKKIINKHNEQFINNKISHTQKFIDTDEIIEYVKREEISTFVVGSDQVWRPKYNAGAIYQMFLYFAKDMSAKRLAYAASFGTDEWEYTQGETQQIIPLIQKFDCISVREEGAISLCKRHFGLDAIQVLDPTMLLDKEDYLELINESDILSVEKCERILFHYLLDPTEKKLSFVDKAANELGLRMITVLPKHTPELRTKDDVKNDIEGCILPGPIAWLNGFKNASMVICDSFHGCVFSIIFNKPFWVIGNPDRGMSRFNSLLSIFGLQNRIIDINELGNFNVNAPIDWERVNTIREEWINKSVSFLASAGL